MSLTSAAGGGGGGVGGGPPGGVRSETASLSVPALRTGEYAAWRPRMEAYLMRHGLEETYTDELPDWVALHAQVRAWDIEKKRRAIAIALGRASGVKTKAQSKMNEDDESAHTARLEENAKREVRTLVEHSIRAFGMLFEAMPDELRAQTAHIPQGYAFGVWTWLEKKYQSTEIDCVNELIEKWMELRMDTDESFDAYRARVNKLCVLLEQAKEKPSARIYAYKLLDKLQPCFKPAVLALKAGEKLRDPADVDWEDVTAFITSHERSESRLTQQQVQASEDSYANPPMGAAMSAMRHAAAPWTKNAICYNCNERGHIGKQCTKPRPEGYGERDGRNEKRRRHARETVSMARRSQLTDSDDEISF
jgi:hypothetical protein